MTTLILAMLFVASVVAGPSAQAIDPGTADGILTVGKEAVPLKFALAHAYDNAEGLNDGPELRILLADREVQQALLAGFTLGDLETAAHDGKLRGLLLKLDPQKPAHGVNGTLLIPSASPRQSLTFFAVSGSQPVFERLQIGDNRVVGTFRYQSNSDSATASGDGGEFSTASTFSAPIFHDPPISARLTGREALDSPAAQAVIAYEKALRAGNIAELRRLATPARVREIEDSRAQMGEQAFRDIVVQAIPDTGDRLKQPWKVFVRGNHAIVVVRDNDGEQIQGVTLTDGGWKVD